MSIESKFNSVGYIISNNTDYLIEFSRDKASARIQLENNQISEWIKIEYINLDCTLDNPGCYNNICRCDNTPVITVNDTEVYLNVFIPY